jgi:hypothetical protein
MCALEGSREFQTNRPDRGRHISILGLRGSGSLGGSRCLSRCRLQSQYTYARAPKAKADDCIAARADRRENEGIIEDNFIRIDKGGITGFEWHCRVKAIKAANEAAFTFAGACGDEGTEYDGVVTLLLRPGRMVIVHRVVEGRHVADVYRLRDDLQ